MSANPKSVSDFLAPIDPRDRLSALLSARPALVRAAPSPTGFFHVGTARTALHNYLAAKASGGKFLLRLDDTDAARNQDAFALSIADSIRGLGLAWDDFFRQSDRGGLYAGAADALRQAGLALLDDSGALRIAPSLADDLPAGFLDLALGDCAISQTSRDHARQITLLRSDGSATYQFASVVDDIDAGINLTLRGGDHLANVPKQMAIGIGLARAGFPGASDWLSQNAFAHVGLITQGGKKVSKRDPGSDMGAALAQAGPKASLHWALRLGWSHPDPDFDRKHPLLDLGDMPGLFRAGRLRGASCDLNLQKLDSLAKAARRLGG